ncbi:MAG TPA: ATP-binding cassette domain-containing protein [Acidimicrobiia bacterium]|nr:ATP-binding cassette domain-containing protein [Acidimicrobiia bacterium]
MITVAGLVKYFRVHRREPGLRAGLRGLVRREFTEVRAVDGISFRIAPGEVVGFLGPNGAGKTTTLKCLAGLLYPDAGELEVAGFQPYERHREFLTSITFVMGQRNQLFWDLPAMESFLANKEIYRIPRKDFEETLDIVVNLLEIGPYLDKPVRNLSLGERMRCELAGSLLHRPQVLFLDEPTLGLDVTAQASVRRFVSQYSHEYGATVLLTSHYMADITALARRVLVIDRGVIRHDGDLAALLAERAPFRQIALTLASPVDESDLARFGTVVTRDNLSAVIEVPRDSVSDVAARMLSTLPVSDVSIEDPPIEEVIARLFADQRA